MRTVEWSTEERRQRAIDAYGIHRTPFKKDRSNEA
jgi:hypothetical protein